MTAGQYLPISEVSKVQSFVPYVPTRTVSDGVLAASTTVTSATAAFVASDVGAAISGGSIPGGATIASVTNATTVIISAAAGGSAGSVTLTITKTNAFAASVFGTALTSAFAATAGTIQTLTDAQVTGNCLVVSNDSTVLTVAPTNSVSYYQNTWQQLTPTQLAASYMAYFTS